MVERPFKETFDDTAKITEGISSTAVGFDVGIMVNGLILKGPQPAMWLLIWKQQNGGFLKALV